MKSLSLVLLCLIAIASLGQGCSRPETPLANKPNADNRSASSPTPTAEPVSAPTPTPDAGPGDPKLTLNLVLRNIDQYEGKRVRWYGEQISAKSNGKDKVYLIRSVYVNPDTLSAKNVQAFVVEYTSNSPVPEYENCWVTGTVKGKEEVLGVSKTPKGATKRFSVLAPVLINPKFEEVAKKGK